MLSGRKSVATPKTPFSEGTLSLSLSFHQLLVNYSIIFRMELSICGQGRLEDSTGVPGETKDAPTPAAPLWRSI